MAELDRGGKRHVINSRLENLRNRPPADRFDRVAEAASLATGEWSSSSGGALPLTPANGKIDNVIDTFELPVGIATNLTINGRGYLIPMVIEEPSVVAAASYTARILRQCRDFQTSSPAPLMRAQIQVLDIIDPNGARKVAAGARCNHEAANVKDEVLAAIGGGRCEGNAGIHASGEGLR